MLLLTTLGDYFFLVNRKAAQPGTPNRATDGKSYETVPLNPENEAAAQITRYGGYTTRSPFLATATRRPSTCTSTKPTSFPRHHRPLQDN